MRQKKTLNFPNTLLVMDGFVIVLYLLFQLQLYVGSEKHLFMKLFIQVFRFPEGDDLLICTTTA